MKIAISFSLAVTGAALASLGAVSPAQALTINFDDLPRTQQNQFPLIPNGYQGFTWDNFATIEPTAPATVAFFPNGSGYQNGVTSGTKLAFNALDPGSPSLGGSATLSNATAFTLNSANLVGAWRNGMTVLVQGFEGTSNTASFSQNVVVNTLSPNNVSFNFTGVNRVTFTSPSLSNINNAGLTAGFADAGGFVIGTTQFGLDDLTVTLISAPDPDPTPDPAAIPVPPQLLGTVFGASLGFLKARKRRKTQVA
jgi:hypothetical protein